MGSDGRAYTTDAHTLPTARSQGEPLTGRFNLATGQTFVHSIMSDDDAKYLLVSDAGYGFVSNFNDMVSRNKNGKALISLPEAAKVLSPQKISHLDSDCCLTITSEGRMLVFPVKNLPVLSKGKGNKIINIPTARAKTREEYVTMLCIVPEDVAITLHAGKRKLTLKAIDIEHYKGERGRRGNKLPRGLQRVSKVEIELAKTIEPENLIDND